MKNYYDELEISKTASKEVIERVYKVLAKKYHPDTTQEADKQAAEEKFKIISEAYEVLSNDEKRKKYDLELENSNPNISYEEYMDIVNQRDALNNTLNNLKNEYKNSNNVNPQHYSNTQPPYNQADYNYSNNAYNNKNTSSNKNANNSHTNSKKRTYYYTDTGKPASAFAYYKYKIKQFLFNISLIALGILALLLAINAFSGSALFSLFMK